MRIGEVEGVDTQALQKLEKLLRQSKRVAARKYKMGARPNALAKQRVRALQSGILAKVKEITLQMNEIACHKSIPSSTYKHHTLRNGRVIMRCAHTPFHDLES